MTQDVHYENYRSERLAKGVAVNRKTVGTPNPVAPPELNEKERILQVCLIYSCKKMKYYCLIPVCFSKEKEAELRRMQQMLAQMQAQMAQQQPQ